MTDELERFREAFERLGRRRRRRNREPVDGLAGCVSRTVRRRTGTLVGVYRSEPQGLDPATPWHVVCETHGGTCIGVYSRRDAMHVAAHADFFCEGCRDKLEGREGSSEV